MSDNAVYLDGVGIAMEPTPRPAFRLSGQESAVTMDRNEKLLLLQVILEDIRGNWGDSLEPRVDAAERLADDLELPAFQTSIAAFREDMEAEPIIISGQAYSRADGRHFRMGSDTGGYEGMSDLHGLPNLIAGRSVAFRAACAVLTFPENRFDDWEDVNPLEGLL